ncbi:ABC transporter permease [Nocardiopsis quinghaiensis]|uniref:ABC transporter permease n=1 Tax=Nocardiopsis quinghaiensis TaxID=464995 RepID=UPI00168089D3|nr:ABC transporter permease [Nocardiopsis quinghaiensis]
MTSGTGTRPAPIGGRGPLALKLSRGRAGVLVAVAVAVLGGSAFVTVGGVLADTGLRSVVPAERLLGADAVVTAPQTVERPEDLDVPLPERAALPEGLVGRLAALPEVGAAVGDVGFPAAVHTGDGIVTGADPRATGHGWSSAALLEEAALEGEGPRGPGEVVLDAATAAAAGAAVGDEVRITAAGRTADHTLSGVLDTGGTAVLFADDTAAESAGRTSGPREGTVDMVGLRAAPGVGEDRLTEAVEEALAGENALVRTGDRIGEAESPAAGAARGLLLMVSGSLGGVLAMTVGLTVAGTLSVSVAAQRRDLALLRAVGATPRQVRRLVAVPNLLVTLAVLPFGVGAGYLLAGRTLEWFAALGLVPPNLPPVLGPLPALATAVLLPLAVWLAVFTASRGAAAAPPTDALAESVAEPRAPGRGRAWAGALLLLASVAASVPALVLSNEMAAVGPATASLTAVIGLALVGPALLREVSGRLGRLLPARTSAVTWLAVRNLHGHSHRVAGAVSALAMLVAFALSQGYVNTTLLSAQTAQRGDGEIADHTVTAPALGGLPEGLAETVRGEPSVAAAVTGTPTTLVWGAQSRFGEEPLLEEVPALVLGPGAEEVLDVGVTEGGLDALTGDTVALGTEAARSLGAGPGQTLTFRMGDGAEVAAEVVALYERELGFGGALVSRDLARGHLTGGLDAELRVLAAPGRETGAREALERVVLDRPGVEVADTAGEGAAGELGANAVLNFAVLLCLAGYVLLSVANRLSAQTLRRRAETDALHAVGMTPPQIRSLLRREAAMIAVGAVVAGVLASAVPLVFAGMGLLGRPWPDGPLWLLPATVLVVAVVAWLCAELPARRLTGGGAAPPDHGTPQTAK